MDMKLIGFTSVAAILGMGFAAALGTFAYDGGAGMGMMGRGLGRLDDQDKQAVEAALKSNDYAAFKEAISDERPQGAPEITQDRFDSMVKHYNDRQARDTALANGYDAWLTYENARPKITDIVTRDNFEKFVAMHKAMERGDISTARSIATELGLPAEGGPMGGGFGRGRGGMMRGW